MSKEINIKEVLRLHEMWLNDKDGGERADLSGANLSGANLSGANLIGADLRFSSLMSAKLSGADLSGANLSGANLRGADMLGANLSYAVLRGAILSKANLSGAILSGANLRGCSGNRNQIKSIFVSETYPITYTSEVLQIGCQRHAISDWWEFDDSDILNMDGETALKFWREWKGTIRMIVEKSPAVSCEAE